MQKMKNLGSMGSSGRSSMEENIEDEEISRLAISTFQAREEEIERKKMEVKEKVEIQLGRAEEETRRLSMIWEELEVLSDPLRKEVAMVRKKIDMANRELKPLGQSCQKKIQCTTQVRFLLGCRRKNIKKPWKLSTKRTKKRHSWLLL
ncbi:PREDICTED: uncharacterized protein LOC18586712 isoform X2 [Theobroma cacao]|uniref:Uncharacterized protein LOC18586712 isoform X2 n=2 Tax=Theobroma cacao TaxID=3641 RepID=A0AB32UM97_THECC|nr:PREDICTED: uncharacterized protein LOC18586712 isoform X2 [Theobroma cacao]EOY19097.1 Family of Uncharacterized protein function isoform 2 [Theobroma cacao]